MAHFCLWTQRPSWLALLYICRHSGSPLPGPGGAGTYVSVSSPSKEADRENVPHNEKAMRGRRATNCTEIPRLKLEGQPGRYARAYWRLNRYLFLRFPLVTPHSPGVPSFGVACVDWLQ